MVTTKLRATTTGGAFEHDSRFADCGLVLSRDVADAMLYPLSTRPRIPVLDILPSPLGQGL